MSDTMTASPFTSGGRLATPPSRQPPPPAPPPQSAAPQPGTAVAPPEGISGRVVGKFSKDPLCTRHFPAAAELTRLAHGAAYGQPAPFVGTGDPYTALSCACLPQGAPPWKLGDHLVHISSACLALAHDRCHDQACQCECQGSEAARAMSAAADSSLADALRQISATFTQAPPPELADAMSVIAELQAKVEALEAGATAKTPSASARPAGRPAGRAQKETGAGT